MNVRIQRLRYTAAIPISNSHDRQSRVARCSHISFAVANESGGSGCGSEPMQYLQDVASIGLGIGDCISACDNVKKSFQAQTEQYRVGSALWFIGANAERHTITG